LAELLSLGNFIGGSFFGCCRSFLFGNNFFLSFLSSGSLGSRSGMLDSCLDLLLRRERCSSRDRNRLFKRMKER
jgi:hypothetical protein